MKKLLVLIKQITGLNMYKTIYLFLLMFVSALLNLLNPVFLGKIIDSITHKNSYLIYKIIILMSVLFIANVILNYIITKISISLAMNSECNIKKKILDSALSNKKNEKSGKILTNLEEDAYFFTSIILNDFNLVIEISISIITFLLMLFINIKLSSILIMILPINGVILFYFSKRLGLIENEIKINKDKYLTHLTESLSFRFIISVFNIKNKRIVEFNKLNTEFNKNRKDFINTELYQQIAIKINLFLYNIAIIYFGIYFIRKQSLSLGQFVTYITYSNSLVTSSINLGELNSSLQKIKIAVNRLTERIMSKKNEISFIDLKPIQTLSLKNLSFILDDKIIFENVDVTLKKGNIYWLKGDNGTGKTTLFKIISKEYELQQGEYYINSKIVSNNVKISNIGYVTQDNYIFSMSILENILFYDDKYEINKIIEVCKKLNIHKDIIKLKNGYNTFLSPNNTSLSGGQLQRICFARVLIREPEIYLMDEPDSNLDSDNKKNLLKILQSIQKKSIIIITSHKKQLDIPHIVLEIENRKVKQYIDHKLK